MQDTNNVVALAESGLSIIPITEGEKKPHAILGATHDLLTRRATPEEVQKWIEAGVTSWAIAGGAVSGNLVCLDFDEKHYEGLYDFWYERLSDEQRAIVDTCVTSITRNKGHHIRYRTQTSQPTAKLARRVELNKETQKEEIVTTGETKAEGGYALIPPSAGYAFINGDLENLPLVTDEMHEELTDILRTFNEVEDEPATKYEWKPGDTVKGDRPGDRLNSLMSWEEILEPHGWVQETANQWRRPGKKDGEGISATTDHAGVPILYVFSSSATPFEANMGYDKFHVFALLNHNEDFKAAARAANEMYPEEKDEDDEGDKEDPSVPPKNDSIATLLVDMVVGNRDVELFHDEYGFAYARVTVNNGHKENLPCNTKKFKLWLTGQYFDLCGDAPQPSSVSAALATIESNAIFKGREHKLNNRVARDGDVIWYDLADEQGRAVRITSAGWEVATAPPMLFRREAHQLEQIEPVQGGDAMELFRFVNVKDEDQRLLVLVYLVSCLIPGFPHPLLYLHGQQGSAKSSLSKIMRMLTDPSRTAVLSLPKDMKELALQLTRHHMVFYENVSSISRAASDLLCIAVTGGSISKRMLYTDADDFFVSIHTNVGINGINIAATQPDLLERTILLGLDRIEDNGRKNEQGLYTEFEKERPKILGALFSAAAKALAIQPSIVLEFLPRMADFTQWGAAITESLGFPKEEFLRVYQSKIREQSDEALEASTEATALIRFMDIKASGEWHGEPARLLSQLRKLVNHDDEAFGFAGEELPKRASQLMRKLNVVKPNLRLAGIEFISNKKVNGRRQVFIRKMDEKTVQSVHTAPIAQQNGETADDTSGGIGRDTTPPSSDTSLNSSHKDGVDGVDDIKDEDIPF